MDELLSELESQILRNLRNLQSQLEFVNSCARRDPSEGMVSLSTCLALYWLPAGFVPSVTRTNEVVTCEKGEMPRSRSRLDVAVLFLVIY